MATGQSFVLAIGLATLSLGALRADDPADANAPIQRWREELASDEYLVRELAMRGLTKAGLPATEVVRDAAGDSDREVSRRAFQVLDVWIDTNDPALRSAAEAIVDERMSHASPHVSNEAARLQLRFAVAAREKLQALGAKFAEESPSAFVIQGEWKGTTDDLRLFRKIPQLRRLSLEGPGVDDEWIAKLGRPSIERLRLSATSVTPEGLIELADFPRLTELELAEALIDDEGVARLVAIPSLTSLSLDGVPIRGGSLESLAALAELRQLRLSRTRIPSGGFAALIRIPKLDTLDVRQSKFAFDDLLEVARSPSLERVYARSTRLDPVDVEDFRREAPGSSVELHFGEPEEEAP